MRRLMLLAGATAMALAIWGGVGVASSPATVHVRGGEQFVPNALIMSTFRFTPGKITAKSGSTVTWVDSDRVGDEPHTVTVVDQADLPTDLEEVFECQADNNPCAEALAGHFTDPPTFVLDPDGDGGLDVPGDSLLMLPDASISAVITAPAGTTLHYLCALHPWMQGSISVTS